VILEEERDGKHRLGHRPEEPVHRLIRWIHRRRPVLTALVVLAALGHALTTGSRPADLIRFDPPMVAVAAWILMVIGAAVRLWGSGNLRKNEEITTTGVYRMVRHPLYLGSLLHFLAFFLTVGNPVSGAILFLILLVLVYYPTMLSEEEFLMDRFPDQYSRYDPPPRLCLDLRRLRESLATDRFEFDAAYRNLGFRSMWLFVFLPALLWLLDRIHGS